MRRQSDHSEENICNLDCEAEKWLGMFRADEEPAGTAVIDIAETYVLAAATCFFSVMVPLHLAFSPSSFFNQSGQPLGVSMMRQCQFMVKRLE